ncbi:MAG: hypothetical protein L6R37_006051 [Teloschistes peruensis]|nr:MAG: hypothetical protein L6R37_006051 [Teloschistes peruensis]
MQFLANHPGFNQTLLNDPDLCTLETCPLSLANVDYVPNLGGNAFYLAIFSLLLILQLGFGFYWRTWSYTAAMFGGLVLEIIGYVSRVQMHYNPFKSNPFLMYIVVLTIAPCFLTAAIYLCLSRIILIYGEHLARFKPRTYTIIFISCDVFSLVLQAIGGAMADTADAGSDAQQTGINVMIAGLAFQVVSLSVFATLCLDFAWSVRKSGGLSSADLQVRLRRSTPRTFYAFIGVISLATLAIYIRSVFRVAELCGGFSGRLANDEITFMVLEGAMVSAACIAITAVHPGFVLGKTWSQKKARAELAVRAGGVGMVGRRVGGVEKVEVMGSDEELKR